MRTVPPLRGSGLLRRGFRGLTPRLKQMSPRGLSAASLQKTENSAEAFTSAAKAVPSSEWVNAPLKRCSTHYGECGLGGPLKAICGEVHGASSPAKIMIGSINCSY